MNTPLRDYREPRDWRIWRDPPGFFTGQAGCFCCPGTSANAYHLGGDTSGFGAVTAAAYRTVFSTDVTTAITGANLSQARRIPGPFANPSVAGYVLGGLTGAASTTRVVTADKLTFSGETTAAMTTADLPVATQQLGGISERSTKGYTAGGFTTAIATAAYKTTFSTDATAAQTTADLSTARGHVGGMSEGTTKGYWNGGFTSGTSGVTRCDKITFSSDTSASTTTADLTAVCWNYGCMSDGSTKGYWAGGQTGASFLRCDKITFSTDTTTAQTSANIQKFGSSCSSNGTYGYMTGGVDSVALTKTTHKFTFSTDLNTALGSGADISVATSLICGFSTAAL